MLAFASTSSLIRVATADVSLGALSEAFTHSTTLFLPRGGLLEPALVLSLAWNFLRSSSSSPSLLLSSSLFRQFQGRLPRFPFSHLDASCSFQACHSSAEVGEVSLSARISSIVRLVIRDRPFEGVIVPLEPGRESRLKYHCRRAGQRPGVFAKGGVKRLTRCWKKLKMPP